MMSARRESPMLSHRDRISDGRTAARATRPDDS
jgi:hypothetical protein